MGQKFLINSMVFMMILSCSFASLGASGFVTGQVEYIRTHDASAYPTWAPPLFWATLKGVVNAGACQRWASGTVLFVFNDSQSFSLLLSAQASGQELAIHYDDALTHQGYCIAKFVTVGSPPPAF